MMTGESQYLPQAIVVEQQPIVGSQCLSQIIVTRDVDDLRLRHRQVQSGFGALLTLTSHWVGELGQSLLPLRWIALLGFFVIITPLAYL